MAQGDWPNGAMLRPLIINLVTDGSEAVLHIGVGYDIVLPSGQAVGGRGYTWQPSNQDRDIVLNLVRKLLDDAVIDEGLSGVMKRPRPPQAGPTLVNPSLVASEEPSGLA